MSNIFQMAHLKLFLMFMTVSLPIAIIIIARLVRRKQQSGIPSRLDEGEFAVVHRHLIWNIDSHRLFSILIYCK